jgi:hypothetical protein
MLYSAGMLSNKVKMAIILRILKRQIQGDKKLVNMTYGPNYKNLRIYCSITRTPEPAPTKYVLSGSKLINMPSWAGNICKQKLHIAMNYKTVYSVSWPTDTVDPT